MSGSRFLISLALLLVVLPWTVSAQVPDSTSTDPLESVLETIDLDDVDAEQLVELLSALLDSPLDINSSTRDELAQVPALGLSLAQAIVVYREARGLFRSMPELQLVPGITEDVFVEVRPFLTIGERGDLPEQRASRFGATPGVGTVVRGLRFEAIQRLTRRLDTGVGYAGDTTRTQYGGGPERLYTRLRASFGKQVTLGLTAEKDPGEALRWSPTERAYGYDHVAGHLAVYQYGRIESLVIGDFVAAYGQGLVLWRGLSGGKGREVIAPVVRSGNGIRGYGSTEENRFFRGAAAALKITPSLAVSLMASRRALDATIESLETPDELGNSVVVSSLGATGLHRTPSEILRRDEVTESFIGGVVEWSSRRFRIGAVGYKSKFDTPIGVGVQPYQRYRFSGDEARVGSVFASAFLAEYVFFGEAATDQNGAVAAIGGVAATLGRSVRAVISLRSYDRDYTNLHSFAFGETNGATQNESGMYLGLQIRPNARWRLAGFIDQYRFPWVRFGVPRPSTGYEALALVEHKPRRWLAWYVQARTETKADGYDFTTPLLTELDAIRNQTRQTLRAHLHYEFSRRLTTRTRVEGVRFEVERESPKFGILLFQDLQVALSNTLRLDTRLMLFDTDDFDSRVFAYEYDLRYTFAVPAFSGQGHRMYAMATYQPRPAVSLQVKYAVTRFEHVQTLGSGLDETDGNRLREIRVQLIWRP